MFNDPTALEQMIEHDVLLSRAALRSCAAPDYILTSRVPLGWP